MFKNALVRAILLSSGSIPVARNPNITPTVGEQPTHPQSTANEALFRETFKALDREEAIGVFPEGTSYTECEIAQVKDGASRAALEYVKWAKETRGGLTKKLLLVPVGIVYTDKSQYQSRVSIPLITRGVLVAKMICMSDLREVRERMYRYPGLAVPCLTCSLDGGSP